MSAFQPVGHHGVVLTVRRVPPRRGARSSAALTTAESVTALVLAHTAAGGDLPGLAWLLPAAAAAYGASSLVFSRRASVRVVLPVLIALQLFAHAWLVTLTAGGHAAHPGELLGLSGPMLAAHLAAGAVTAAAWLLRRRAVDVVVACLDGAEAPAVQWGVAPTRRTSRVPRPDPRWPLAPTRGPPQPLLAAA